MTGQRFEIASFSADTRHSISALEAPVIRDHVLVEAIRDENGRPSTYLLSQMVGAHRRGEHLHPDIADVIAVTEHLHRTHVEAGRLLSWSDVMSMAAVVLEADIVVDAVLEPRKSQGL